MTWRVIFGARVKFSLVPISSPYRNINLHYLYTNISRGRAAKYQNRSVFEASMKL